AANADAWRSYVDHAFVRGLGDGSLPRSAYLAYLRQDYLFLVHFARAWALVVVKSGRIDEMREAAATVSALIDAEMRLHVETCAAEGLSEDMLAATEEAAETLAYTRFVMDAGLSGDILDLLAALAPCVFGYGEIGAELAQSRAPETPYAGWIDTYAGADYQQVCCDVGALFETVVARRIGDAPETSPRWPELIATFNAATRLEADFWAMGLRLGGDG
ncbi:MAG: TenA family protein, partial [Pseudomonadota bacterium]